MKKRQEVNFRILDEDELTDEERAALEESPEQPRWRLRQRPLSQSSIDALGDENSVSETR